MISLLGFDRAKAQLLLHYYLYSHGALSKHQAVFKCPYCDVVSILSNTNMSFNYSCNQNDRSFFLSCIINCINQKCEKETVDGNGLLR